MPRRSQRLAVLALCVICLAPAPPNAGRRPPAVAELDAFIAHEMRQKDLPAFTIAVIDDQRVVWSKDYGTIRGADTVRPTPATVYRVGAVSQIVTDLGLMQLVEQHALDLDAPVERYVPGLHLETRAPVTLRTLMTGRAGLDREPPVGGLADDRPPALPDVVRSLNASPPLVTPGHGEHPSDAGVTLAGYVIEATQHQPFARYVERAVLRPLGMSHSTFARDSDVALHLARGTLWTYDPREFPAPAFDAGVAPAENLYATTADLARLLSALFADGHGTSNRVLAPGAIAQALGTSRSADTAGVALGFRLTQLGGRREIEQHGTVAGFSTTIAALPNEKLGVVAITTLDGATAVTQRVASLALRIMLAARHGDTPPPIDTSAQVPAPLAQSLAGHYAHGDAAADLVPSMGHLYVERAEGGERTDVRLLRDTLVADGRLSFGARVLRAGDSAIIVNGDTLRRVAEPEPAPVPDAWRGLIGEYGPDFRTAYVIERHGTLELLADWFDRYALRPMAADTFAMPDWGPYAGERVVFSRAAAGRAERLTLGGVALARRVTGPEDGSQFRITPLRPTAELRTAALAAQPPHETGTFRAPDLVELVTLDSTIELDIRYATSNNFMGTPLYQEARAFMQRPAAEAVVRASAYLRARGYGLLIHDAYRPWFVTKMFWDATPDDKKMFVADPASGSKHNRGCAVDLTLYALDDGHPVQMTGGYDEMTDRSYPDYPGGTSRQRWLRALLRQAMEMQGFTVDKEEWWHFDYKDWREYGIGNVPFDRIAPGA
jgi:D-alanyl-D-alanine dipeptidase/CubicO group peptidase (beta-lactamase class C family)